jgi:GNAT superfamily N-acetyltransferase
MRLRLARPGEADALTALCRRSKAAWGYDDAFMAASAATLTVTPEAIEAGRVFVAEDGLGRIGIAAYIWLVSGDEIELDLLFVEPGRMRSGAGRALLAQVAEAGAAAGARRLIIAADPQAGAFYERCGAVRIGDTPSDAIPGRMLPLYVLELAR